MMSGLGEFIKEMKDLEKDLESADSFFKENRSRIKLIAQRLALQTIEMFRPDGVDPDRWTRNANRFTNFISVEAFSTRMNISYGGRDLASNEDGDPRDYNIEFDDIVEWVEAGATGHPEGKNITERESGKGVDQIAHGVWGAIKEPNLFGKKNIDRLREAILRWINREVGESDVDYLNQVLDAWFNSLCPIIGRAFEGWVSDKVDKAFK